VISARRLVLQAVGSAGANVWLALLGLVTTPYVLLGLGSAAYGVFAMVSIVSAYLSNLEFGFGYATVRYLARARAARDAPAERRVLDTSLGVFLAGGIAGGALLLAGSPLLVGSFFHVPAEIRDPALQAFRIGGLILAGSFLVSFYSAALQALGRFDWLNGSRVVFGTLSSLGAAGVVAAGGGLVGVFSVQAAIVVVSCLVQGFALTRVRGQGARPRMDRRTLREMGAFGLLVFAGGIAYQWMINGPPVVLAARVSSAEIPAFSVPHTVLQKLILLITSAGMAFYPFASAASADGDRTVLGSVFRSHLRLTIVVMGPIVAYLGVFAEPLLAVWVSPEFGRAAGPCLRLLSAATLILALSSPAADLARGLGHPLWVLVYTTTVAVLGMGAALLLVPRGRAAGAALAFLLGQVLVTFPFLAIVARRLLALRLGALVRALGGPLAAVAGVTLAYVTAAPLLPGIVPMLLAGALVTGAYAAGVCAWVLDPRERETLLRAARAA
jgi:O-antigen/teichoic acid export membrane protein